MHVTSGEKMIISARNSTEQLMFLFIMLSFFPINILAQEGEELEEELQEEFELMEMGDEQVVFSASRHQQKKQHSPSTITVITRSQIETAGAFSLADLLRRIPGMEVIEVTPGFTAVNARMPTTYSNHFFLVLIDGREINNWVLGQAFLETQPISIHDIERIEVIRGPASAVYGANAFAGVISITTRSIPREASAFIQYEGGSWSRTGTLGRISTNLGWLGLSVSTGYEHSGYPGNSRALGKDAVTGRTVLEFTSGQDSFLRFDANGVRNNVMIPTAAGKVDGEISSVSGTINGEYHGWKVRTNYTYWEGNGEIEAALEYNRIRLAQMAPFSVYVHDLDLEGQRNLPFAWKAFTMIVGGGLRGFWGTCDSCLDREKFANPQSPGYHERGAEYSELRTGIFTHFELTPWKELQTSATIRFDYNTDSGFFLSPRLAVVGEFLTDHFLRFSASRAFRKLAYIERHYHPWVYFPESSPLKGEDQIRFLEFMGRVVGNESLPDEKTWAFELGYQWSPEFLNLELGTSIYLNIYSNYSGFQVNIITTSQGLPDLYQSTARFELQQDSSWIAGFEAFFRYSPAKWLTMRGSWSYRYCWFEPSGWSNKVTPAYLFSLGGEAVHTSGFIGSLYLSGRSRSEDWSDNPRGLMEPLVKAELPLQLLVQGRAGYQIRYRPFQLETGIKFIFPLNLSEGDIGFFEHAGGITPEGAYYGGAERLTSLLFYLKADF